MGRALQASEATFPVTVGRKDTHQLVVGLSLDKDQLKQLGVDRTAIYAGALLTASGRGAARGAADAVQQYLALKIFRPPS
jgi:hypothetical protein